MLKPCHLPQSWGHLTSCFVTISQNYSNQNNMVLALKTDIQTSGNPEMNPNMKSGILRREL